MQKTAEIKKESGDAVIDIALDTIRKGKQALVFVGTKKSAEKQAEDISKKAKLESIALNAISEKILNALSKPTHQCERLAKCVKQGIAFHHAGLTYKQRNIIESCFRNGEIKVICCTPTLAAGLDMPAFRAVIRDLKRYGGKFGMAYIPVLEYLQMAGRAGRPKFDSYGEAILIAKTEPEKTEIYNRYIIGEPEEIYSKLAVEPVLRSALLSLIASNFVHTRQEIMDFFSRTFWAHQFKDMAELEEKIGRTLKRIEGWGFIISSLGGREFVSADSMGEESYNATALGERVSQLYLDPLTAFSIMNSLEKAMSLKVLKEFSFLQVVCSALEMRPLLSVRPKEFEDVHEKSAEYEAYLLQSEPSVYEPEFEDYLESIKTALMFQDWMDEKTEEQLMEDYNIRPGETRVKLAIGDWLLYCADEIARIMNFQKLHKDIRKTRFRLKHGVKEELIPLIKLEKIGRARARLLFRNRLKTVADIKKADFRELSGILGAKIAAAVKEQLGEKVSKEDLAVPKGKRKGQLSLEKF